MKSKEEFKEKLAQLHRKNEKLNDRLEELLEHREEWVQGVDVVEEAQSILSDINSYSSMTKKKMYAKVENVQELLDEVVSRRDLL